MSSVPTHSNVLGTIDSISFTDLGAQFALQVGERILAIDDLEEHALEVSVDDCFPFAISQGRLLTSVGSDSASLSIIAHAVAPRGANVSWVAEQFCRDLMHLGRYGRVTLRSDVNWREDLCATLCFPFAD